MARDLTEPPRPPWRMSPPEDAGPDPPVRGPVPRISGLPAGWGVTAARCLYWTGLLRGRERPRRPPER
ncbi:hypothetical protein [Limimaricola pyoseonensis]|uniref:hypothetical protein n=1 Tax=Limimaricola pyoseonensis TaxID=521013 RepID=UPI0010423139|nr:hypothetical protein [Limimaricola pyoseonensis]